MEDLNSPRVEQRIQDLYTEIAPYVSTPKPFSYDAYNYINEYVLIPIVILILLVVTRPSFLSIEIIDEDDQIIYKTDWKKVISYWLLFSLICILGLYGYRYRVKTD